MRVCFAHGGQLAQMNLGRRIQGLDGRPDLFEGKTHPRKAVGHPNIYFDTLVHDTDSLNLMLKRQGSNQIIMGLDDPFPLGEVEGVGTSYPGRVVDYAQKIKSRAHTTGYAVWDLFEVFGGNKNIFKNAAKGLMSRDKVHYSKIGYEKQADLFFEAFLQSYELYKSTK